MSRSFAAFAEGFASSRRARADADERTAQRQIERDRITADRDLAASSGRRVIPDADYRPREGSAPPYRDMAAYVTDGLINRGMSPMFADAFVMNFDDESGLDPDITEGAANVHGTYGRGLYQLTDTAPGVGRRSAYEKWAQDRGDDLYGVDSQLDYLMHELNGSEAAAWKKIQRATTRGEAASEIVRSFLRPAREHRDRRIAKYMGRDLPRSDASGRRLPAPELPTATPGADIASSSSGAAGRKFTMNPGAAGPWLSFGRAIGA
ncbi:hypothetical protein FNJ84_17710 [Paracoccus sp. M683]|uniref:phage tail tip lysozyme n=1 Tax=Paracoccus sp. M683 TaxID=2594268 RepID=UPI00117F3AC2|nr:phage tail tip lysozyme [Paracoccus sp. M683]TRW94929.1 hypothetical protein FNJ84_17710 [Paracoccus sp. M683]